MHWQVLAPQTGQRSAIRMNLSRLPKQSWLRDLGGQFFIARRCRKVRRRRVPAARTAPPQAVVAAASPSSRSLELLSSPLSRGARAVRSSTPAQRAARAPLRAAARRASPCARRQRAWTRSWWRSPLRRTRWSRRCRSSRDRESSRDESRAGRAIRDGWATRTACPAAPGRRAPPTACLRATQSSGRRTHARARMGGSRGGRG